MKDHQIRIAFLDFDGTLYSHSLGGFPASAIEALKKLKENRILTFICSGRSLPELDLFPMDEIDIDGIIISNGQLACYKDKKIFEKLVDGELKTRLIHLYNEARFPIYFATKDQLIMNYVSPLVYDVEQTVSSPVPDVAPYSGEDFYMASAFFPDDQIPAQISALTGLAEITLWHPGAADIVPAGMSKEAGIKAVCDYFSISQNETLAIGDGDNDLSMIRYCAIGIAMGNSPAFVKEAADYVTDDIDADGLARALAHYELF